MRVCCSRSGARPRSTPTPQNLFVAQFVGSPVMNVAPAAVRKAKGVARVTVEGAAEGFAFPRELFGGLNGKAGAKLSLGIRPEGVLVAHQAAEATCRSRRNHRAARLV